MASNESNELAHTSLKEELDVLTAIYGEDLKIHSPKTEDGCVSANTGMRCDGREVPLMLPLVLDVTINQEMSVHFHLSDGYPFVKPTINVQWEKGNSKIIENKIKDICNEKEENFLYDAIEFSRAWPSDSSIENLKENLESVTICKFFLEGKCRFGDKCINKHPSGRQNGAENMRSSKAKLGKSEISRNELAVEKSNASESCSKKTSMKTATDVISRIQWDNDLPTEDFIVGYLDRFIGIVEKSFNSFSWEDIASVDYSTLAVPKHRIQYFKYKDTVVWDKRIRLDKVFGSTGDLKEIYDIVASYNKDIISIDSKKMEEEKNMSENLCEDDNQSCSDEDDSDSDEKFHYKQKRWGQKDRPNFFFCFKVTNDYIKKKIFDIQQEIVSCNDLLLEGCLKETEFHVTLCMLQLKNQEEKAKAVKILETMQQILVCMLPSWHTLTFERLGNFRGRVLHVEILPDYVLSKFVSILILKLKDAGLNPCGNREQYRPHVTILKLSRPMCRALSCDIINPNFYQHRINDYFGNQAVNEILLCSTSKERNQEGFYVDIGSKVNSLLCLSDKLRNLVAENVSEMVKESIMAEGKGDEIIQALLSGDEYQFEMAICHVEKILNQNSLYLKDRGNVFIMRGLQGSGKSYIVKHCMENKQQRSELTTKMEVCDWKPYQNDETADDKMAVCSADDFFETKDREYSFSPSELADAHRYCRMKFMEALSNKVKLIIIDNTNSKKWEYQVYKRIAKICGYSTQVFEISCKDDETFAKFIERSQHKVDKDAIRRAWNQWETDDEAIVVEPQFDNKQISLFDMVRKGGYPKMAAKEVLFSGLFLDDASKRKLLDEFPPIHSKCTSNHMTYCYKPIQEEITYIDVGKQASVTVVGYIVTDLLQVVAVKEKGEVHCTLEVPHVTISHSKKAAPQHAKMALQNRAAWRLPEKEIVLTGRIGVQVSVDRKKSICVTDAGLFKEICRQIFEENNSERKEKAGNDDDVTHGSSAEETPIMQLDDGDVESLFVFDFDGTLFKTPDPVLGRKQYQEFTGETWPHKGWIGRPESLQWPLQTFPGPSFADFHGHLGRARSLTVLLTGRLQRTFTGVREVLREYGVHPQRYFLKPDDMDDVTRNMERVHEFKRDVVRGLLKENPSVKIVKIWDDRRDNIDAFKRFRKEYKSIDFELFQVDTEKPPQNSTKNCLPKNVEFGDCICKMAADLGFGCSTSFDSAVKQGMQFLGNIWLSCIDMTKDAFEQVVRPFGSYPLKRFGDIDLCLLAPASLTPDECIIKLEAELLKRGLRFIHIATGIRCPRMKVRVHFLNAAPVDYDITFATCLQDGGNGHINLLEIYEIGNKAVKSAVEGLLFLEKVQSCIAGKLSTQEFGRLVDIIVYYLKTKHLKGNAFHCIRTFQLVRALAEMLAKSHDQFQGIGDVVIASFSHLATLDAKYWHRICKETVPEEIIQMTASSFVSAISMISQSKSCSDLFTRVQFPPKGHIVVSIKVTSHVADLQWRACVLLEAKLGACIRKLYASGVLVVPGPCDYLNELMFAIPPGEMNVKLCENILASLKFESIFVTNKSDLVLKIKIGDL